MRYTIELHTAAGALLVGLFDTLEAARTAAAGHRCAIRPVVAADDLAAIIAAPTAAALKKLVLDEPATHALNYPVGATPRPTNQEKPVKAHEYAETIAEEIRALETALDGPSRSFDPDDATQDDEQDTDYRAALDVLEYAHDIDPTDILATYENETVLELIYWHGSNGTTRTEWLRTYGGPTCRIYFESDHYAEIVSTGDDNNTARVSVYVPTLANMVDELAEMARA